MPKRKIRKTVKKTELVKIPRIFSEFEIRQLLAMADATRYPIRNRAIVLLATDAGLAINEIAQLKRWCVQDEHGFILDDIDLVSKPGNPKRNLLPRTIPMPERSRLRKAISTLLTEVPAHWEDPLIISERALEGGGATKKPGQSMLEPMRASSIGYIFWKLCDQAGLAVAGAQTARRTFIVKTSRRVREIPGTSLRDVQDMTGHRSLLYMQRLVEVDKAAQRLLVDRLDEPGVEVEIFNQKPVPRRGRVKSR